MFSMLEYAAITYLSMSLRKKNYALGTFGLQYLKYHNNTKVIIVKYLLRRCVLIILYFTLWFLLDPFLNRALVFWSVIQHRPMETTPKLLVENFTKWDEAIPTFSNDGATTTLIVLTTLLLGFGYPRQLWQSKLTFLQSYDDTINNQVWFSPRTLNQYYP